MARRGFTLLEVMIALALLGFGLVVLIKATTGNIRGAKRAQMMGVATDLSRAKMYDIEEKLLKEGFTETDQSEDGEEFDEEGWPEIKYAYKVEQVELPSFDQLQALGAGSGSAAGSARGSGSAAAEDGELPPSFQDSTFGQVISNFGGFAGGGFAGGSQDIDAKGGAAFIQTAYQVISEGLKASIRKVTLTVKYDVLGEEHELVTVAFFTDAAGMDKGVLNMLGSGDVEGATGSGSGTPPVTPTPPRTPTPPTGGGPRR
jgi:general secretion pathway protein I